MAAESVRTPIIFTHFGTSTYLEKSLMCATITNPHRRRILLGDGSNQAIALAAGWEHVLSRGIRSDKRDNFNALFYWIQGAAHCPVRANQDWLRYVFERWFFICQFCQDQGFDAFWHFDSDALILRDLDWLETMIDGASLECTSQCNGICMNGFVRLSALSRYIDVILALFQDDEFLQSQLVEFESLHPGYAFTEMRAFSVFMERRKLPCRRLFDIGLQFGILLDDYITQSDGFKVFWSHEEGKYLKSIHYANGKFYAIKGESRYIAYIVGCSFVSSRVFDWFLSALSMNEGASTSSLSALLSASLVKRFRMKVFRGLASVLKAWSDWFRMAAR